MALVGQAVSEKKIFEIVDGRTTDDGRTPDHGHPISSPCEPNGSGELTNAIVGMLGSRIYALTVHTLKHKLALLSDTDVHSRYQLRIEIQILAFTG